MTQEAVTIQNGWALYGHPFFIARFQAIVARVKEIAEEDPEHFQDHPLYALMESVAFYAYEKVPENPADPIYRQGSTLGKTHQHWFRVKNGLPNRYRMFFQFRSQAPKTIIYAWLNDESTLRKANSRTDAYAVFKAMIESSGSVAIPDTYEELLAACQSLPPATQTDSSAS